MTNFNGVTDVFYFSGFGGSLNSVSDFDFFAAVGDDFVVGEGANFITVENTALLDATDFLF